MCSQCKQKDRQELTGIWAARPGWTQPVSSLRGKVGTGMAHRAGYCRRLHSCALFSGLLGHSTGQRWLDHMYPIALCRLFSALLVISRFHSWRTPLLTTAPTAFKAHDYGLDALRLGAGGGFVLQPRLVFLQTRVLCGYQDGSNMESLSLYSQQLTTPQTG